MLREFPNYEINNKGDIRRIGKSKNLAPSKSKKNFTTYLRVTLFKDGIRYYRQLHRLVAESFIDNPNNLPQIDHIDGNGENNNVKNLDWVTSSENIKRSFNKNPNKLIICSNGGKKGGKQIQAKAKKRYEALLKTKFIKFYPANTLHTDAAITYKCECGNTRTASIMWKEIRKHLGKCPYCTNTVNRSSESLI